MRTRGGGDVVNVLDIGGGANVWRHDSAYTMTKAALASLTKSLALELAPDIRVNGVAPGTVLPPEGLTEAAREALRGRIPAGDFGQPGDVVAAVQFLVTGPRFITGQVLAVDGGRSLAGG
jgi:pteridine reductase